MELYKNCSRKFIAIYLFSQILKITWYSKKLINKLSRRHLINSSDVFVSKGFTMTFNKFSWCLWSWINPNNVEIMQYNDNKTHYLWKLTHLLYLCFDVPSELTNPWTDLPQILIGELGNILSLVLRFWADWILINDKARYRV